MVRRAKALLALVEGQRFPEAGRQAGMSRQAVAQFVERFHQSGMTAALTIVPGRGRKPTYGSEVRQLILETAARLPDRQMDATATWSLKTLERALRKHEEHPCRSRKHHPSGPS